MFMDWMIGVVRGNDFPFHEEKVKLGEKRDEF
jgi:hypothetical protein